MKQILTEELVDIPEGVTVSSKARNIEVKGPLGTLKRSFKHVSFDLQHQVKKKTNQKQLRIQMWFGKRKEKCCVTTVASHIKNMIRGVTKGYKFRMRFAYAHFPIQANVTNGNKSVEIKNFLGEKYVRKINCLEGVVIERREEAKDELMLKGTDLQNVSLTCALINQCVRVKEKDIRQFLDGIYVSDKRMDYAA